MKARQTQFDTCVLNTLEGLCRIGCEWSDLWQRCLNTASFQRPEWLLPWVEVFAPENLAAIEVRWQNLLVGFAPLLIYPRDSDRVLALMGGGVSDYLDVLVEPTLQTHIVSIILDAVSQMDDWTILDLTDLPSHSVLRAMLPQPAAAEHNQCSALSLREDRNELLHLFSKRQRANLRNASSRLRNAGGGQVEIATLETLPEFLDDLFRLHATRWSQLGQPGVLHQETIKAFHRAAAPRLLGQGVLRLYRLRLKQQTLAVIYALFERETVFCYLQGFDPDFAYFSPGTQLMFAVIEEARQRGIRKFDFLRGDESYKQHWRAQPEATYRIQLRRSEFLRDPSLPTRAA